MHMYMYLSIDECQVSVHHDLVDSSHSPPPHHLLLILIIITSWSHHAICSTYTSYT